MLSERTRNFVEAYKKGMCKPTGQQYEYYVACEFHEMGYTTWVTRATRDFGTDVIVQINPYFQIIFQCKYYSSKVGSHAVQEICAAKEYYKAQMCVVITNQEYTEAAKELAAANHILLVSNFDVGDDIERVCETLGLIPEKYVTLNKLILNDVSVERDVLLQQVKSLEDELFDYRVDPWWNPVCLDEDLDLASDDDLEYVD